MGSVRQTLLALLCCAVHSRTYTHLAFGDPVSAVTWPLPLQDPISSTAFKLSNWVAVTSTVSPGMLRNTEVSSCAGSCLQSGSGGSSEGLWLLDPALLEDQFWLGKATPALQPHTFVSIHWLRQEVPGTFILFTLGHLLTHTSANQSNGLLAPLFNSVNCNTKSRHNGPLMSLYAMFDNSSPFQSMSSFYFLFVCFLNI